MINLINSEFDLGKIILILIIMFSMKIGYFIGSNLTILKNNEIKHNYTKDFQFDNKTYELTIKQVYPVVNNEGER